MILELQEFFGYVLWPDCRYETALFLIGKGSSGKSTILNVLQALAGEENCSNVSIPGLENEFHRATLLDKTLNVFTEADSQLFGSSYVKAIVSGDRIDASFKHRDPFQFRRAANWRLAQIGSPHPGPQRRLFPAAFGHAL